MKFNIADPRSGGQKKVEIDDESKIRPFFEKRMGQEVEGEVMGEDYKGYILKITGGNDQQGFAMKQGTKKNDVCKYVAKREIKRGDKTHYKAPKIQRLITEKRLRRKKVMKREKLQRFKTSKEDAAKYEKLISQYVKEKKAARAVENKEKAAATETKK